MTQRLNISDDWGTLNEVAEDLFRLRLFNPRGALLINTWIYRSNLGLVVIDPGWPWTLAGLESALAVLGGTVETVHHWLYTHTHIDHMGLAAQLSRRSDAPQTTWSGVAPHVGAWHAYQDATNDWSAWGEIAFAEPARTMMSKAYKGVRKGNHFAGMVDEFGEEPLRNADFYEFGATIKVADLELKVLDARGHDPYHIALFEPSRGWLFSGDVILATPTPLSRGMGDDLQTYAESLERLAELPIELLLPGHGVQRSERIDQAFDRARGFISAYRASVHRILGDADGPLDLYSLALASTPNNQPFEPMPRWWVHLSNLDSALIDEVKNGRVCAVDGPKYHLP
jgi:glyoxylase-like metal-dependent hydrolase (beta-lactamase superfamily II)